jgi:hypothetical protein
VAGCTHPEEDNKVAERILTPMEVVDCFDVKTLRLPHVREDLPVSACWSMSVVSIGLTARRFMVY